MAEINTGMTLAGATGTVGSLLSIDVAFERSAIETTTYDNTATRTYKPGTLYSTVVSGTVGIVEADTATLPDINGPRETWTVTFGNNDTWEADGFLTEFTLTGGEVDNPLEASFTLQMSGPVTVTAVP